MPRRAIPLAALAVLLAAPLAQLPAQTLRPGLLVGRVLDATGEPVGEAILRATQGAKTIIVEADDEGDFRIAGLAAGVWTISVRRLGFRPVAADIDIPAQGLRRDFTVERLARAVDAVLVAEKWTGIRGIVGDARRVTPLAGASVRVVGADGSAGSDSTGGFAIPMSGGRSVLLRVERAGFASRLISVALPPEGYVELDVALDTVLREKETWVYRDLDQRLKFAAPRSVQVSREEIEATDAVSLGTALGLTRSVTAKGVVINRRACVYVNGVARPGYPIDAILAGDVEFVEAYPPGSDLTRTLALKWPPGGTCGVADGTIAASSAGARQVAQYVSVWLRAP